MGILNIPILHWFLVRSNEIIYLKETSFTVSVKGLSQHHQDSGVRHTIT